MGEGSTYKEQCGGSGPGGVMVGRHVLSRYS